MSSYISGKDNKVDHKKSRVYAADCCSGTGRRVGFSMRYKGNN